MPKRNKVISIRVDENIYNYYLDLAVSAKRKLADYIRLLLEENYQRGLSC